jgi:hypothetical protein
MHSKATKLRIKFNRMRRAARLTAPKPSYLIISRVQRAPVITPWAPTTSGYTSYADFMARGWRKGDVFGVRLR